MTTFAPPASLCRREPCPFGTPCSDAGVETALARAPMPTMAVCTEDEGIIWCNDDAARLGVVPGVPLESVFAAGSAPHAGAMLAAAARSGAETQRFDGSDLSLENGPAAAEVRVVRLGPPLRIAVVYVFDAESLGLRASADARSQALERAVRNIAQELAWVGLDVASEDRPVLSALPGASGLSDREREVLCCVAGGQSAASIAEQLFVSASTVRNYLSSIYSKLNVQNRAELLELILTGQVRRDASQLGPPPDALDHRRTGR